MADIKRIKLPNGTTYNIKDSAARTSITNIIEGTTKLPYGKSLSITNDVELNLLDPDNNVLSTVNLKSGGVNIWPGTWTNFSGSVYTNLEIHNSVPLKVGDIIEVYDDKESNVTLSKRYVDVSAINSSVNNKIIINMNGDSKADTGTSIGCLSPARRWNFLVVHIYKSSGDRILIPINIPMTIGYETYIGNSIEYNDTNLIEAASKVLAGYGCGSIYLGSTGSGSLRIYPMDSKDSYVRPTDYAIVRAPSGRCTYIFYYATATNAITKLSNETIGGMVPSIPYLALAPYNGGHTYAPLYFDQQNSAALRGWKFANFKNFTSQSYNWFIIDTIN